MNYKLPLIAAATVTLAVAGTLAYNVDTTKAVNNTVPLLIQDKDATMPTNNEPSAPDKADIAPVGKAPDSVPVTSVTAPVDDSDTQTAPQPSPTTSDVVTPTVAPSTDLPTQQNPQIIRDDSGNPIATFYLAN